MMRLATAVTPTREAEELSERLLPLIYRSPTPRAAAVFKIRPPAWKSTPVVPARPKVLTPPSCRLPAPALTSEPVLTAVWMIAVTLSPAV